MLYNCTCITNGIFLVYPDLATTPTKICSILLILVRACATKRVIVIGLCVSRSVGECVCPHVFSRTVAVVDTKRGYVGMCNGRSAQI